MTYNGISEDSVAIYTTFGNFLVNGSQTFNTTCRNDEWDPLPTISVTIGTTSGRLCIYIHTLYVPCAFFCNMHVHIYIIIHDSLFMGGTMCIACERALGEPSVLYIIMLDFHFPTCNVHVYIIIVCTRCNFTPC